MFKEQLRAILRASAYGHVRIMFPMIISWELQESKKLVEECKEELRQSGIAYDEGIEMGMMMETQPVLCWQMSLQKRQISSASEPMI